MSEVFHCDDKEMLVAYLPEHHREEFVEAA